MLDGDNKGGNVRNLNHNSIWGGLDNLACRKNISVSRMAILSDIDSTTFNKSKRADVYGRLRWPSTETLVKVLNAMDVSWSDFENYFPEKYQADAVVQEQKNNE